MLKRKILFLAEFLLLSVFVSVSSSYAWECEDDVVPFTHQASEYYGSGEYFAVCPETVVQIRCYHYHRHWVCEKEETFYWDRNLESAARTACDCPLREGVSPSSPAISKEPASRFHNVPVK